MRCDGRVFLLLLASFLAFCTPHPAANKGTRPAEVAPNAATSLPEPTVVPTRRIPSGHQGEVRLLEVTLKRDVMATAGEDGKVIVRHLPSYKHRHILDLGDERIDGLRFNRSGKYLSLATNARLQVVNLDTRAVEIDFERDDKQESIASLAYHEELKALAATHSDGRVDVVKAEGRICTLKPAKAAGSVAFLPKSNLLLVAETDTGIAFHDVSQPACSKTRMIPLAATLTMDALWPFADGNTFLVGALGEIRLIDVESGRILRTLTDPTIGVSVPVRLRMPDNGIVYSGLLVGRDLADSSKYNLQAAAWSFHGSASEPYRRYADYRPRPWPDDGRELVPEGDELVESAAPELPLPYELVPQSPEDGLGALTGGIEVSPDGRHAMVSTNGFSTHVWDLASEEIVAQFAVVPAQNLYGKSFGFFSGTPVAALFDGGRVWYFSTNDWSLISRSPVGGTDVTVEFVPGRPAIGIRSSGQPLTYITVGGEKFSENYFTLDRTWGAATGTRIIRSGFDGKTTLYEDSLDLASGTQLPLTKTVQKGVLSFDGSLFIGAAGLGDKEKIFAVDLNTNKLLKLPPEIASASLRPILITENYVIVTGGDAVRVDRATLTQVEPLPSLSNFFGVATTIPKTDRVLAARSNGSLALIDVETGSERDLSRPTLRITDLSLDPEGQIAAISCSDGQVRSLDFRQPEPVSSLAECEARSPVAQTNDGIFCSASYGVTLHKQGKQITPRPAPWENEGNNFSAQQFQFDGTRSALLSVGFSSLALHRAKTGEVLKRVSSDELGMTFGPGALSRDGKQVAVASASLTKTEVLWLDGELKEKRRLATKSGQVNGLSFSPDGTGLAVASSDGVFVYDQGSSSEDSPRLSLTRLPTIASDIRYDPSGKILWVAYALGEVHQVDVKSGAVLQVFSVGPGVTRLSLSENGHVWAFGADGIAILDQKRGEVAAHIRLTAQGGFFASASGGQYWASRQGLAAIRFRHRGFPLSFEQLDPYLNQPDVILSRLGLGNTPLYRAQNRARAIRLSRLGIDQDERPSFDGGPTLEFGEVPRRSPTGKLEISLKVLPHPESLRNLNIWVNGVPFPRIDGLPLSGNSYEGKLQLPIVADGSLLEFSASDASGRESPRRRFFVEGPPNAPRGSLRVLAVGVGDYGSPHLNLKLTTKDARDVARTFADTAGRYQRVETLTLLDRDATAKNIIEKGRAFLEATSPEDQVVIFFAGHGLRDEKDRFYFAAHGVDPEAPARAGLPMSEIEALVDGIPALQRLILIDSCFSGLVDELPEDGKIQALGGATVSAGEARGFTLASSPSSTTAADSRTVFYAAMDAGLADLRRGSGAVVIAAAAGREFALESSRWNNGVFSFSVLESLKTMAGDTDHDGVVSVAELQRRVAERVRSLTSGAQTPIARQENLVDPFRLGAARPLPSYTQGGLDRGISLSSDTLFRTLRPVVASPDLCSFTAQEGDKLVLLGPYFEVRQSSPFGSSVRPSPPVSERAMTLPAWMSEAGLTAFDTTVSSDGRVLGSLKDHVFQLHDFASGKLLYKLKAEPPLAGFGFDPNGDFLALIRADSVLELRALKSGELLAQQRLEVSSKEFSLHSASVRMSPGGDRFLVSLPGSEVLWERRGTCKE